MRKRCARPTADKCVNSLKLSPLSCVSRGPSRIIFFLLLLLLQAHHPRSLQQSLRQPFPIRKNRHLQRSTITANRNTGSFCHPLRPITSHPQARALITAAQVDRQHARQVPTAGWRAQDCTPPFLGRKKPRHSTHTGR